jgi:hypothetical protein
MPAIRIVTHGFTGGFANANSDELVEVSRLDLLRSMITVGYRNETDLVGYGWRSIGWHIASTLFALVTTQSRNGNLCTSHLYHSLDRSEKNTVSYRLGMGFTKFVAEHKLQIPWLVHVDKLFNTGALTLQGGTLERGDLAGEDTTGRWHAFESKGRSQPPGARLLTTAKNQVRNIASINGVQPATSCVCISHLYGEPIKIELTDPAPSGEDERTAFNVNEEEFFRSYYGLLPQFLDLSGAEVRVILGQEFVVSPIPIPGPVGLSVGVLKRIKDSPETARQAVADFSSLDRQGLRNERFSIGLDGVIAVLG